MGVVLAVTYLVVAIGVMGLIWWILDAIRWVVRKVRGLFTLPEPLGTDEYKSLMDTYVTLGYRIDISLSAFRDISQTKSFGPIRYTYHAMLFNKDKQKVGYGVGRTAEEAAYFAIKDRQVSVKKQLGHA